MHGGFVMFCACKFKTTVCYISPPSKTCFLIFSFLQTEPNFFPSQVDNMAATDVQMDTMQVIILSTLTLSFFFGGFFFFKRDISWANLETVIV